MRIQEKQPIMWSWIKTLFQILINYAIYIYILLLLLYIYIYIHIWGWTSINPSDFGVRTPSIQPTGHVVNFQPRMAHGDASAVQDDVMLIISMLHLNHLKHPILMLMISSPSVPSIPSVPSVPSIFRAFQGCSLLQSFYSHTYATFPCFRDPRLQGSFRCVKAWLCPVDICFSSFYWIISNFAGQQ